MSGSRDALLFDTLQANQQSGNYLKWQGRLFTIGAVSEAVAAVAAGIIASQTSIEAVLLIQWLVVGLTIPLCLLLREIQSNARTTTPALLQIIRGSIHENRTLRDLNLFAGSIGAATLTMVWFVQPHWKALDIDILYFGYLWALLNLTVGIGAFFAHRLERWMRFRTLFGLMAIGPLLLFGLSAIFSTSLIALAIAPGYWLLRDVSFPIISDYVQREARDGERATVMSINALVGRLLFSICSPFLGWVADIWSLGTAFAVSALVFGILSVGSFTLLYVAMRVRPA